MEKALSAGKCIGICSNRLDPFDPNKYKIAPTIN